LLRRIHTHTHTHTKINWLSHGHGSCRRRRRVEPDRKLKLNLDPIPIVFSTALHPKRTKASIHKTTNDVSTTGVADGALEKEIHFLCLDVPDTSQFARHARHTVDTRSSNSLFPGPYRASEITSQPSFSLSLLPSLAASPFVARSRSRSGRECWTVALLNLFLFSFLLSPSILSTLSSPSASPFVLFHFFSPLLPFDP
jgi:hypothetical protein